MKVVIVSTVLVALASLMRARLPRLLCLAVSLRDVVADVHNITSGQVPHHYRSDRPPHVGFNPRRNLR
ncbi:uncharacterized protein FOMMEDRAFT_152333 [Fomitiporia mediterranea MF3/22]|uniref:uncharacterized protein n=1 Tax=Fomitiporia mediterranea (strain MF3/22) TaxID=694068 RepID=UPI000440973C|nr:uncharacterized protein FOMMEDRAFT_152333 [Fomitiporia mediterranea MF3/22]EJD06993.1 hypothetical protein FOMMEDRAFT_152333 [Fomitiporia mediterranea MF3/22]